MLNRSSKSNMESVPGKSASSVDICTTDFSGSPHPITWSAGRPLTYCRVLVLTEIVVSEVEEGERVMTVGSTLVPCLSRYGHFEPAINRYHVPII